jgi:hypothetical protein
MLLLIYNKIALKINSNKRNIISKKKKKKSDDINSCKKIIEKYCVSKIT